ncbi:hypothetical protein GCM10010168_51480 [Actinoplanes ianthinogenes]|uniref:Lipoprotein n=1 Tax=Actinoplanes ianthinogenes TaxID=122358 RepID=A0ABM7M3G7_9ACTN|nr:hypothetical protein [Actinoplanes ianthinogenes]BCJ46199.1 hypothetical protein Aiant_68560 [Actinoplanes ianthinogenes]GGR26990.1 hypothetical protein GCM10010168_51480 [Actinoplanes ianthinogenes]
MLKTTPAHRAAVAVTALAAALVIGACTSEDRGAGTTPADTGASPSACAPPPGGGAPVQPAGTEPSGAPSGGPDGDCGATPPAGAGGGGELYPDVDPSNFTPHGTNLWEPAPDSPSGASGDVLPAE